MQERRTGSNASLRVSWSDFSMIPRRTDLRLSMRTGEANAIVITSLKPKFMPEPPPLLGPPGFLLLISRKSFVAGYIHFYGRPKSCSRQQARDRPTLPLASL